MASPSALHERASSAHESSAHQVSLAAPIDRWDEAIPLGNGQLGVLLWGEASELRLSLDRADLWDRRPNEAFNSPRFNWRSMRKAVARGDFEFLRDQFERPCRASAHPTKLPLGRVCLELEAAATVQSFNLDMSEAVGAAVLDRGTVEVFCDAHAPVVWVRVRNVAAQVRIVLPPYAEHVEGVDVSPRRQPLTTLGYEAGTYGTDGDVQWARQPCADGAAYAIVLANVSDGPGERVYALTASQMEADGDPVNHARERLARAVEHGYERAHAAHRQWWGALWARSAVRTGQPAIDRHYRLVRYLGASGSRVGAPPMPLQGVWTADEDRLPPWKGDYHHDLNTQLCYWPYLAMNDLEQGACFLDWLWDLLPYARRFAHAFYGTNGACLPATCSIDGEPMGGWHQYSFSPTCSAWLAHAFYRHWRYTMDPTFLAERAWPFCEAVATCLYELLETDEAGRFVLPLSSSPEIHGNHPEAWFASNTNFDLSLLRWLFGAMVEMGERLGHDDAVEAWAQVLGRLPPLPTGDAGIEGVPGPVLMVSADEPLTASHRHLSHMMAIHPLGLLDPERSAEDRALAVNTIRQLDFLGMSYWTGFTFTWLACMAARAGLAERALAMLELYLGTTVSRNGFHLNGDFRQLGILAAQYRPFTLEANFAAAESVHEMLLQSWGGVVRVFPAAPEAWADASFEGLRAEGAFLVSGTRQGGRTRWVRVVAERGGMLRLRDPFGGNAAQWNRPDLVREGEELTCTLAADEMLEGRIGG